MIMGLLRYSDTVEDHLDLIGEGRDAGCGGEDLARTGVIEAGMRDEQGERVVGREGTANREGVGAIEGHGGVVEGQRTDAVEAQ